MSGKALVNGFDASDFPFKNLWLMASGGVNPGGLVDANGYLTSNAFTNATFVVRHPLNYYGRYRIRWNGSARIDSSCTITIHHGGANYVGNRFDGTLPNSTEYVEFSFAMSITNVADNGSGLIRVTTTASNDINPKLCRISGVVGTNGLDIATNGDWTATRINSTTWDLVGSSFPVGASYTSGGSFAYTNAQINWTFTNSGTFSGFGGLVLCRSTAPYDGDFDDILSGDVSRMFNNDFVSFWSRLNSKYVRMLDLSGVNVTSVPNSDLVTPVTNISYGQQRFPPNLWSGTIHDTGNGAFTCSAAPDTPGAWTDNEVFQGQLDAVLTPLAITGAASGTGGVIRLTVSSTSILSNGQQVVCNGYNSSGLTVVGNYNPRTNGQGIWTITVVDSTHLELTSDLAGIPSVFANAWTSGGSVYSATVDCGSRGAKLLIGPHGNIPELHATTTKVTCIYSARLNSVVLHSNNSGDIGLSAMWPLEVRVGLCNKLGQSYYHNFPHYYSDASAADEAAYISANLAGGLSCACELSNEFWNFGTFTTTTFFGWLGSTFSASNSIIFSKEDYAALRFRQMMEAVAIAWGTRSPSELKRTIAYQAANLAASGLTSRLFGGSALNGTTYPLYAAAGFPNYDTAPNRPGDFADAQSIAIYWSGAVLQAGGLTVGGSLGASARDITLLTGAADAFVAGNFDSAYAWVDNDIRYGAWNTKAIASISGGDTINITSHGLSNGQSVVFSLDTGASLYSGISLATEYFVVSATSNAFKVSATSGGSPLALSGGSGTIYIGRLSSNTLLWFLNHTYSAWRTNAIAYDLEEIDYEGGYEGGTAITTAQCTAAGISTSYGGTSNGVFMSGGSVYDMLVSYKNSRYFYDTVTKYLSDRRSVSPQCAPAWYKSGGADTSTTTDASGNVHMAAPYRWSLLPNDFYIYPAFQSYNAMLALNEEFNEPTVKHIRKTRHIGHMTSQNWAFAR